MQDYDPGDPMGLRAVRQQLAARPLGLRLKYAGPIGFALIGASAAVAILAIVGIAAIIGRLLA